MEERKELYDVVIIGGGPAGLSAAIYLSRAKYRVLVLEKAQFGGQITITHEVVNYPGVGKCSGKELTDTMYHQAEYFGADFLLAEAVSLEASSDVKTVKTNRGDFSCLGILLASGAHPRKIGFTGEEEYQGRGVAYCATCDGEFFTGKEVFVIGGGYAAAEESIFLTKFASHVTILIRKSDFSCAKAVADRAKDHEKITVLTDTVAEEVRGEGGLQYLRYRNIVTDQVTEYRAKEGENFGVFVFAGYEPETALAKGIVTLNEQGYVVTDASLKTSVDGIYAAGDLCVKPLRQVITAAGDGALAATELEKYVAKVQERTGLRTAEPKIRKSVLEETQNPKEGSSGEGLFDAKMRAQLESVFARMAQPLILHAVLDDRPVSEELHRYLTELTQLTERLSLETEKNAEENDLPCVRIYRDGQDTGLGFHGVPGGHEFTSFVLGLYNAAGPGQPLGEDVIRRIKGIRKEIKLQIMVTLSCTMCPELVVAAQHIAAFNEHITAHVYDIHHNESLKKKYQVMSVPCMIVNEKEIFFGKKTIDQLLEILEAV